MTPVGSYHRRFSLIMWGTIGVAFMAMTIVAVYGLDTEIAGYAFGILVLVCLAVCGAAFWLDARTARATNRLVDKLHHRSDR